MKAVQSNGLETFEHFKARLSLPPPPPPPPPPQSSVRQNESLSQVGRSRAGPRDPRGENPVLKSSDRPGSRGTDRRKDNNRFKNQSLQHKYCSSINTFLFRWGQFCNFLLTKKKIAKIFAGQPVSIFARPVGPWWRVASLYIHTRGRLEDNAEAAPSIPSPHSLICISMTHREHFAF